MKAEKIKLAQKITELELQLKEAMQTSVERIAALSDEILPQNEAPLIAVKEETSSSQVSAKKRQGYTRFDDEARKEAEKVLAREKV